MDEDWNLIVSTFATQYSLRERDIAEMDWIEFSTLLSGIMPETPLGNIVQIRSEEDKDTLKSFTKEQHSIRNSWRSKHSAIDNMTDEEKNRATLEVQQMFKNAFG